MGKTNDDPDKTLSINRAVLKKWVKNLQRVVSGTSGGKSLGRDDMFRTDASSADSKSAKESSEGSGEGKALTQTELAATAATLQQPITASAGSADDGPDDEGKHEGDHKIPTETGDASSESSSEKEPSNKPVTPPNPSSPLRAIIKIEELKSKVSRMRHNRELLNKYNATITALGGKRAHLYQQSQSSIGTPTPESIAMKTELEKITETLENLLIKDGSK